jgi:PKD domain
MATGGGSRRALRGEAAAVALVIAAAVCGGLAVSAGAATWLAPVSLTSNAFSSQLNPEVAFAPDGSVTAVWAHSNENGIQVIETSVRPAGDEWQAPVRLSPEAESAEWPSLAIDAEGNAIVVWERFQGAASDVEAPVQLSGANIHASSPQVAVDAQGDAIVVWARENGSGNGVIESTGKPHGSETWQTPVALSGEEGLIGSPHVALDAAGDAVAVWKDWESRFRIEAATRPSSSGVWRAPVILSAPGENASGPKIAVDPEGEAIAVWDKGGVVETADQPAGSEAWQAPVALLPAGQTATEPEIAIDGSGNAVAVWEGSSNGVEEEIESSVRPSGSGTWQPPALVSSGKISPEKVGEFPELAVNAEGAAVAAWDQWIGNEFIVEGSTKPAASGVWQGPVALSATGQSSFIPWIAIDPWGNAVAAWQVQSPTLGVGAAGYDAGPMIDRLGVPKTGTVGNPVSFSSSPLAVWSALAITNWSFGDGASTSGISATHVYTAPGIYTVTLSSIDALDNASSASATIAISPAHTTPALSTTPPALTDVSMINRRFRVSKRAKVIAARKAPLGTSFRFTLSALAKLQITISRSATGLRENHICRAPSAKLARAHAKHCTRTIPVEALTRASEAKGPDSISFSGRIGHHALSPGAYTATLSASNPAGRSKPVTLSFTIVR